METNYSIHLNGSEVVVYDSTISRVLWILSMVVVSITFFLGVLGNGLVIWVAGFRMPHTVTTIWYLNLALADFSFTATLPFLLVEMAMKEKWPFGWFLCKLVHIVVDVNLFGSVFLIALIALDRCICVLHPVWAQNHRTVSLARKVVVGPWIFALILTLPIFIFLTTVRIPGGDVYCTFNFGSWAQTDEEKLNTAITFVTTRGIIRFLIGFSMPMSIVAIAMDSLLLRSTEEALLIPAVLYESLQQLWLPSLSAGFPFSLWPFWAQSGLKRHCLVVVIKFLTCLLIQQVH